VIPTICPVSRDSIHCNCCSRNSLQTILVCTNAYRIYGYKARVPYGEELITIKQLIFCSAQKEISHVLKALDTLIEQSADYLNYSNRACIALHTSLETPFERILDMPCYQ